MPYYDDDDDDELNTDGIWATGTWIPRLATRGEVKQMKAAEAAEAVRVADVRAHNLAQERSQSSYDTHGLRLSLRQKYEYNQYGIPYNEPYSMVQAAMAREETREEENRESERRRLDQELEYYQAHPTKSPITQMPRPRLFGRHERDMQEERRNAAVAFNAEYDRQRPYDGNRSIDPRSGNLDAREQAADLVRMRAAREAEMEAATARARAAAKNVTSARVVGDKVEYGTMEFIDKKGNTFYANPETLAQQDRDSVSSLTGMMSRLNPFGGGKKYRLKRFRKSRRHNKSNPHNKSRRAKKSRKTKRIR